MGFACIRLVILAVMRFICIFAPAAKGWYCLGYRLCLCDQQSDHSSEPHVSLPVQTTHQLQLARCVIGGWL